MEASRTAKRRDIGLLKRHLSAPPSNIVHDHTEKRSLPRLAVTREMTPHTTSFSEDQLGSEVFSTAPTVQNSPTSTARHSLSSTTSRSTGEGFTESIRARTESHPERPYHVSTRGRKYLFVTHPSSTFRSPDR